ncbi:uncharacterized protein METZ01_LOCUS483491, partial [marine metagenome]
MIKKMKEVSMNKTNVFITGGAGYCG